VTECTLRLCVLLAVVATPSTAAAQKITGVVVDATNKPVMGVDVELHPTSPKDGVQKKTTDKDGVYEFNPVQFSAAYDIVYSHSKMDLVVISRLAEKKAQEINNVMYRKGQPRPALALLESVQSAERLIIMAVNSRDSSQRTALLRLIDEDVQKTLLSADETLLTKGEKPEVVSYLQARRKTVADLFKVYAPK
jgi:hypothetical protein